MERHQFSSPVVVTVEAAPGRKRQYPIRDLYKAMAMMRWHKLEALTDIRTIQPGIWLVAMSSIARAQEHPNSESIEHAREMFALLAKAAGILSDMAY